KRAGELDANPLPLGEQLTALEKKLGELQKNPDKPSSDLTAAEAEAAKTAEEADKARKALEEARAEQAATENEVVRLKEEATRNPPPADITAKLAAARATRFQARQAATNALEFFETSTKKANVAKDKLAQAKSENPAETLAATKAALAK